MSYWYVHFVEAQMPDPTKQTDKTDTTVHTPTQIPTQPPATNPIINKDNKK